MTSDAEKWIEMLTRIADTCGFPNQIGGNGTSSYVFLLDEKGNETIAIQYESRLATYSQTADDGTLIQMKMLKAIPHRAGAEDTQPETIIREWTTSDASSITIPNLPPVGTMRCAI